MQVTVDRAKNRTADTGGWELVYRQPLVQQPQYSGISLTVQGTKMHLSQRWAALQHLELEMKVHTKVRNHGPSRSPSFG